MVYLDMAWKRIKKDIADYWKGILAVILLYLLLHHLFDGFCPSVLITGFPCPGCGMTRATLFFLRGEWKRSIAMNPSVILWIAWLCFFFFERYIKGGNPKILGWIACGILGMMIAVYCYRMVRFFPDRPPYVYSGNNFFARMLPGYNQFIRRLIR